MKSTAVPAPLLCNLHDNEALAPLLERLLRYARSKLRNRALAEDAVSETLLAALEAEPDVDVPMHNSAWLFGVLKHKLVDQLRKLQREQPGGDMMLECDQDALTWSGTWRDSRSAANDPERACRQAQLMVLIGRVCEGLPAVHAKAFQMREIMDMDTEHICDCLGVNRGNLWVMTHRARRQLRLELSRHGATPGD